MAEVPEVLKRAPEDDDPIGHVLRTLFQDALRPPPPIPPFETGFLPGLIFDLRLMRERRWARLRAETEEYRKKSILDRVESVSTMVNMQLLIRTSTQDLELRLLEGQERVRELSIKNRRELIQAKRDALELRQMEIELKGLVDGSESADRD